MPLYITIATGLLLLLGFVMISGRYRVEITAAREKAVAGSQILKTKQGDIEYAVIGEGRPILLLHGAGGGYDQGFLIGRTGFGDGFMFISVSRFGYLRSPIPEDSTLPAQAALYATLLDHLKIECWLPPVLSADPRACSSPTITPIDLLP